VSNSLSLSTTDGTKWTSFKYDCIYKYNLTCAGQLRILRRKKAIACLAFLLKQCQAVPTTGARKKLATELRDPQTYKVSEANYLSRHVHT